MGGPPLYEFYAEIYPMRKKYGIIIIKRRRYEDPDGRPQIAAPAGA